MITVFFETTIFNRFLEDEREYSIETKQLYKSVQSSRIKPYTSTAVVDELLRAPEPKRGQMLALIQEYRIITLPFSQESQDLADIYVEMGVIPAKYLLDGFHIATASVNNLDFIVSLNFTHINKAKTKTATDIINRMKGYSSPIICTPSEVLDYEK